MKFIDSASITVQAGKGGDGCLSFRRERAIPLGGPNGGDGGDGGDIYLVASDSLNTLAEFRFKRLYRAKHGQPGQGTDKKGKSAQDLFVEIPIGTAIFDVNTDEKIGEITKQQQKVLVAKGGFHGLGNARFKSSINRSPRQTTKGSLGEERELSLELTVLADVGLLGLPNAGKSSFIRQVSSAKPKVADYPFTTLHPNLGVVTVENSSFVIADIPGVIEGASEGLGLGLEFLKHLSRTKILLHIVDVLPADESNPVDNYYTIEKELEKYSKELSDKPKILALNKLDLIPEDERKTLVKKLVKAMKYKGRVFEISAINGLGCKALIYELNNELNKNVDE
jgi:GTP-binding protein